MIRITIPLLFILLSCSTKISTTELTEEQYKLTMTDDMIDVTTTAEAAVDIWPYVNELVQQKKVMAYVHEQHLIESVYRNETSTFEHVVLPTDEDNLFVVILVDIEQKKIKGHYTLDLNKEYGIQ